MSMAIKMPKWKGIFVLATLFLANIIIVADYILSPTVAALYQLFPDSVAVVNFVISGPYLVAMFSTPIAGRLCSKFSTRLVFIFGLSCAAVGCIFLMLFENPYWMAAMRCLFGIGYGFANVSGVTLLNQLYFKKQRLATMMGFYTASIPAVGSVIGIIAGNLATISIAAAYKTYLILAPLVVMAILFIPKIKNTRDQNELQEEKVNSSEQYRNSKRSGFSGLYWVNLILLIMFNAAYYTVITYLSVYILENSLGTVAMVGYVISIKALVAFLAGLTFGLLFAKVGEKLIILPYSVSAVGLAFMYFYPSPYVVYVAVALLSSSYILGYSFAFTHFPCLVSQSRSNEAISLVSGGLLLGTFLSTYMMMGAEKLMGWTYTQALVVPMAICIIITIVQIIIISKTGKQL